MTHTEIQQADLAQFTEAIGNADEINELLLRYGVKFGIYKNGTFKEQFFPFDPIPRVIPAADFKAIEQGLVQRVNALNEFLFDIYHDKKIVQDGIIPEDFIYISKGYLAQCEGITPPERVYSHISGIDLVQGKDGIPARYIAGLAFCDGETHAWVEYWNADHWEGFDPANNCPVSEEYLVLSQGRDFGDYAIDRGVMLGSYTRQMQLVRSALS